MIAAGDADTRDLEDSLDLVFDLLPGFGILWLMVMVMIMEMEMEMEMVIVMVIATSNRRRERENKDASFNMSYCCFFLRKLELWARTQ